MSTSSKLNTGSFLAIVRKSGLIEETRLNKLLDEYQAAGGDAANAAALADFLVQANGLTRWQSEKLLQGRHKGYFLGKYRLLQLLGKGGMSAVYLAEHTVMRRRCAIKVLPTKRVTDSSYLARFHREAQAVASLDHPNIVRAYDVDHQTDNETEIHFLVMEYVDGMSLQEYVVKHGPLPFRDSVEYIRQAALGLSHAHKAGLVHRDVKPGNLLLANNGVVKVLDLGLARFFDDSDNTDALTIRHDEKVLGTADYLSPEQALDSHTVDARADIYSLGCTLYFMLCGHPPFTEGTLAQRLMAHQTKEPPTIESQRADIPPTLAAVLRKMMAKQASDRYASAEELSEALQQWLTTAGGTAPVDGAQTAKKPVARPVVKKPVAAPVAKVTAPADGEQFPVVAPPSPTPSVAASAAKPSPPAAKSGSGPDFSFLDAPASEPEPVDDIPDFTTWQPKEPERKVETKPVAEAPEPVVVDSKPDTAEIEATSDAINVNSSLPPSDQSTEVEPSVAGPPPGVFESPIGPPSDEPEGEFGWTPAASDPFAVTISSSPGPMVASTTAKVAKPAGKSKSELSIPWMIGGAVAGFLILSGGTWFFLGGSSGKKNTLPAVVSPSTSGESSPAATGTTASATKPKAKPGLDLSRRRKVEVGPTGDFRTIREALDAVRASYQPLGRRDSFRISVAAGDHDERITFTAKDPEGLVIAGELGAVLKPTGDGPVIRFEGATRCAVEGFEVAAEGKPVAIEIVDGAMACRVSKINAHGFTKAGVLGRGASGSFGDLTAVIENCQFVGGGGEAVGVVLEPNGGTDCGYLAFHSCDFRGSLGSGVRISGKQVTGIDIRRSVFDGMPDGVVIQGQVLLRELVVSQNTFHQVKRGIVFEKLPADGSRGMNLRRNLFASVGQEAVVVSGYDAEKFGSVLERGGSSLGFNLSDKAAPATPTPDEIAPMFEYATNSQRGLEAIKFQSTNPQDPKYFAPFPGSPAAAAGEVLSGENPWIGARQP
ncbi:MAG: protein kinase [Planctomycetaceae bacterium]|nr:protein kinase [Planctomycetaceae bacterium]